MHNAENHTNKNTLPRPDFDLFLTVLKWSIFSVVSGLLIGAVGIAFHFGMEWVTETRHHFPWLIFLLPLAGLVIVGLYRLLRNEKDTGTNLVLAAVHSGEKIPLRMAPLIFLSTLITHLFGGSAGREGAALQIGGSIGSFLGKLFRFDEKDKNVMIMCGMSAAFSALFGTPMAAAIFPIEVISVGIMHYAALLPCVIASLTAHGLALFCGIEPPFYSIVDIPTFGPVSALQISALAVLCALVSMLFCLALHTSEKLYKRFFKNPFVRIFVGGCIILVLTLLIGNQDYNGTGVEIIAQCFTGKVFPLAFLLKIIFTALTLGAGYKGGEIVPTFFIGATFGCLFATLTGCSPSLCSAIGMSAVFCGVTNSPLSTLLISFELFGFKGAPFFLLSIALSYVLSGYYGLYHTQKIVYSKSKTNFINRMTH